MRKPKAYKKNQIAQARANFVFEELEPRVLLSADLPIDLPVAFISDVVPQQVQLLEAEAAQFRLIAEFPHKELVFVDTDTPDYQQLIDDLLADRSDERQFEVVLLDNHSDGIDQITDVLSKSKNLNAVHIISHGTDGSVELGNSTLNFVSLVANAEFIKAWGNAFTEDGDLLIYGCDLAAVIRCRENMRAIGRPDAVGVNEIDIGPIHAVRHRMLRAKRQCIPSHVRDFQRSIAR